MEDKTKQEFGIEGEDLAAEYLKKNGYKIFERNYRTKFGEIDIIAEKNHSLYFIEVKTRSNLNHGAPYEAVNKRKIYHIKKAAQYYLLKNKFEAYKLKVAVFSILIENGKVDIKFWDDIDN